MAEGGLAVPELARLAAATVLREDADFSRRFPGERLARVTVRLTDGRCLDSPVTTARGGWRSPLSDTELRHKYSRYTEPVIGRARSSALEGLIDALPGPACVVGILDNLLAATPGERARGREMGRT